MLVYSGEKLIKEDLFFVVLVLFFVKLFINFPRKREHFGFGNFLIQTEKKNLSESF